MSGETARLNSVSYRFSLSMMILLVPLWMNAPPFPALTVTCEVPKKHWEKCTRKGKGERCENALYIKEVTVYGNAAVQEFAMGDETTSGIASKDRSNLQFDRSWQATSLENFVCGNRKAVSNFWFRAQTAGGTKRPASFQVLLALVLCQYKWEGVWEVVCMNYLPSFWNLSGYQDIERRN